MTLETTWSVPTHFPPIGAAHEKDTVHNCRRPGRIVRAGYSWNCCTETPYDAYAHDAEAAESALDPAATP